MLKGVLGGIGEIADQSNCRDNAEDLLKALEPFLQRRSGAVARDDKGSLAVVNDLVDGNQVGVAGALGELAGIDEQLTESVVARSCVDSARGGRRVVPGADRCRETPC